jgi:hypothetical protein
MDAETLASVAKCRYKLTLSLHHCFLDNGNEGAYARENGGIWDIPEYTDPHFRKETQPPSENLG